MTAAPIAPASLADYERAAAERLPAAIWHYIQEGCGAGLSLAANRAALDAIQLVPKRLADLRGGSTEITLFGRTHATPILLAPLAYQRLAHPDGERAVAQAATALSVAMIVSTLSSVLLEDVAVTATKAAKELGRAASPLWFQLYWQGDRARSLAMLRRAEAAGYEAIVVTVDASMKRAGFALPPGIKAANLPEPMPVRDAMIGEPILFGTTLTEHAPRWEDVGWLRDQTRLPLIVKGLLSVADTRLAADHGADGVIVSNHGGRVMDALPSGIAVLAAVRQAMGASYPILVDGAVRSGTDVAKALSLGADAVLVGRPQLHALAVSGMTGVAHMIHLLRAEFELAMAQLGCRVPADLAASYAGPEASAG